MTLDLPATRVIRPTTFRLSRILMLLGLAICIACGGGDDDTNTPEADASTSGGDTDTVPPQTSAELFTWLASGNYQDYPAESGIHSSAGPHGGAVRTFVNQRLADSLADGATSHPVGSAAVKELYSGNDLSGWAVAIKIQADSANGDGWYWYENFNTTTNDPVADDTGVRICTACHEDGADYVFTSDVE